MLEVILNTILGYQPYKMVFVSGMSLVIYVAIVLFITKIYPKRRIPYPILLIGLSILPTISIFREGAYESGDFSIHVARAYSFYQSLREGVVVPRWDFLYNATYGYPIFNYVYPFPYYITSFFHLLGFSFLYSVKLLLASTYILSGLFMYTWLKRHVSKKSAFLGSVFYLYTPYHLIDMHFRSHIGEVTVFMLMPLVFLFIEKAVKYERYLWIFLSGLTLALIVLSHPGVAVVFFALSMLYGLMLVGFKNIKKLTTVFLSGLLGILLSAYYWIPFFLEKSIFSPSFNDNVSLAFPSFWELIYAPWRWGFLFQGPQGEYSFLLGYGHVIIIIASLIIFALKKNKSRRFIFFLLSTVILIFMFQEVSRPVWENLVLLKGMLLTYRILAVIAVTTSALAAFLAKSVHFKYFKNFLIVIVVGTTILNWGNRGTNPQIKDQEIINTYPFMHLRRPYLKDDIPEKPIESVTGDLKMLKKEKTPVEHQYKVYKQEPGLVKENTYYFPGWEVYVDGERQNLYLGEGLDQYTINFNLEEGVHNIRVVFSDTPIRLYSNLISTFTLAGSGLYLVTESIRLKQ